jgi:hypothetical protein
MKDFPAPQGAPMGTVLAFPECLNQTQVDLKKMEKMILFA